MPHPTPPDAVIYAARLMPHRSLGPLQLRRLVVVFAGVCTLASVPFYLLGAWPVVGFFGLDVLLVAVALRASFTSARAYEDVRVTPYELHVSKVSARGKTRDWRFNPAWVRLEREEHAEFGIQRLALASRGRSVVVASFLGADAKAQFAKELSHALSEARHGVVWR